MHGLELKFHVPSGQQAALAQELRRRGGRRTRLLARYFDTADGVLGAHAVSLRLGREGRRWVQTLEASGSSAVHRLEHEVVLRVPAGTEPVPDPARHDGSPAGERLRKLLKDAAAPALVERFTTDIMRTAARLQTAGTTIDAALDAGLLRAGDRELPVCELELELIDGGSGPLFALAAAWRAHGGLWLDTRSKAERGADLAEGRVFGPPVKAWPPVLTRDMSGHAVVQAAVAAVQYQVLGNASDVAAGSLDEEHVHQLRIGLRRLRTALRELGPLAAGVDPAWEERLAGTFGRLGAIRDDETVASAVRPMLEQAHAPRLRWTSRSPQAEAGAIVREGAFQDTLLDLLRWTLEDPAATQPASHATPTPLTPLTPPTLPAAAGAAGAAGAAARAPATQNKLVAPSPPCAPSASAAAGRAHAEQRLAALHRQVVRQGRRFADLPAEEQHRVRKRLKRLRYLAELVASWWPEKAVRGYLKRLSPAQEALGRHNDVVVATDRFLADAQIDASSYFAAGYLRARQEQTATEAQAALAAVRRARRFWKD